MATWESEEQNVRFAGEWLVNLCSKNDISEIPPLPSALEQTKLDEFLALHRHSPIFKPFHIDAIRKCLAKESKPDYRLARVLLAKDEEGDLLTDENDMLQVAIKAARIHPGHLGQSPKASCPELIPICEALISHGALTNCLDNHANSPLVYACILGYEELFRFLVASGARLDTSHPRSIPEQLVQSNKVSEQSTSKDEEEALEQSTSKDEAEASEQSTSKDEHDEQVNLLQITLDAVISAHKVVDMSWIGWPPGLAVDRPMWKLDIQTTWGGIILHLLRNKLRYARDDAGLVLILHIACYQGALDVVEELLELGVATDTASPQFSDMGQGKGRSYGSAMHAAAAKNCLSICALLMKRGDSPKVCRKCILNHKSTDMTVVQVALTSARRRHDASSEQALVEFLEAMAESSDGLEESDHQAMIKFAIKSNDLDFTRDLLDRGVKLTPSVSRPLHLEMARLLASRAAPLDPVAVQRTALMTVQLNLLRWSVDQHGPMLPSDPESWGAMALSLVQSGNSSMDVIKYLVTEYPGPNIDTVLSAVLRLPNQKESHLTPTSWLHLAALSDNINVVRMLLQAGADPACPGLPIDCATAIRTSPFSKFRNTDRRLKLVQLLETMSCPDGTWYMPSLSETKLRAASVIADEKKAWDSRVQNLVDSHQHVPSSQIRDPETLVPLVSSFEASANTLPFHPLGDSESSFRLLELSPSNSREAPLSGRLVHTDITHQPDYEALSYVWGDFSHSQSISLDDMQFRITANLHSALLQLRDSDTVRTLWVDALCINQHLQAERNQQVTIMGDIFKSARQVIVWLGEAADDSHLVFEHITGRAAKKASGCYPPEPEPEPRHRQAWNALVLRPWFFRTWVMQEISLSRKAIVMCGSATAPWMDTEIGWKPDISGGGGGLSSVHSGPSQDPDHPLSGFHADSHAWRLRILRAGCDPVDVMRYQVNCQTSDVRDRVYGLLGLFEPGFMRVDYGLELSQIFREFIEAVIRQRKDLHILTCFDSGQCPDASLPSWVPNLAAPTPVGVLPFHHWWAPYRPKAPKTCVYSTSDGTQYSVSRDELPKKILPGLSFDGKGGLYVNGKLVDTIRELAFELPAGAAYAPGTPAFSRVMKSWETLAATLVSTWDQDRGPSITRAFGATIAASYLTELHNVEIGFTQWYRHCGAGVLELADPSLSLRDYEFYLRWIGIKQSSDQPGNENGLSLDLHKFADQMERASYGRRFFVTEGGSMGLATPQARVGDHIALIPGGDRPFVLRRREDGQGWTMVNNCFLHGLDPHKLFESGELVVDRLIIR